MARKKLLVEDDLDLPYEHLVIVVLELHRGQWYVKVVDRRTNYSMSEGGRGTDPEDLLKAAWNRLVNRSQKVDRILPVEEVVE